MRAIGVFMIALIAATGASNQLSAREIIVVPAGNRNPKQPDVPHASTLRTQALEGSYEVKYQKVTSLLRDDLHLIREIKVAAAAYQVDPVDIIGALVGEHTYNVSVVDTAQDYYMKALTYAKAEFSFSYRGVSVQTFVKMPQFERCQGLDDDLAWNCRDEIWEQVFRGRTIDGVTYDNETFQRAFFQPFFAGQTFGLGQISPLTALEVTSLVNKTSGLPLLTPDQPQDIYRDVMDPGRSIIYIAAITKDAIAAYADQGFDISGNPGVVATLYNLGQPRRRAAALRAKADKDPTVLPEENYYGWLVNARIGELRALLN